MLRKVWEKWRNFCYAVTLTAVSTRRAWAVRRDPAAAWGPPSICQMPHCFLFPSPQLYTLPPWPRDSFGYSTHRSKSSQLGTFVRTVPCALNFCQLCCAHSRQWQMFPLCYSEPSSCFHKQEGPRSKWELSLGKGRNIVCSKQIQFGRDMSQVAKSSCGF